MGQCWAIHTLCFVPVFWMCVIVHELVLTPYLVVLSCTFHYQLSLIMWTDSGKV